MDTNYTKKQLHNIFSRKPHCKTYTVKHLINELQQLPSDLPVVGEWDTFGQAVNTIRVAAPGDLFVEPVVVLDVHWP